MLSVIANIFHLSWTERFMIAVEDLEQQQGTIARMQITVRLMLKTANCVLVKEAIFEDSVKEIVISDDGMRIVPRFCEVCSEIGNGVFLTREEAELSLEEARNSEN